MQLYIHMYTSIYIYVYICICIYTYESICIYIIYYIYDLHCGQDRQERCNLGLQTGPSAAARRAGAFGIRGQLQSQEVQIAAYEGIRSMIDMVFEA